MSLAPLLLLMLLVGQPFTRAMLILPAGMLVLACFTSGVTLLFATFTVFFRDVKHLAEVALQMLLYLSPIFYDLKMLGEHDAWWFRFFKLFLRFNPMSYLVPLIRDPVYYGRVPDLKTMLVAVGGSLLTLVFGYAVFQRLSPRHIHYL
jgi:ABC-type polysaccharide/polyol phosphate export permease